MLMDSGPGAGRRGRRAADAAQPPGRRAAALDRRHLGDASSTRSSSGRGTPCVFFDSMLAGAGAGAVHARQRRGDRPARRPPASGTATGGSRCSPARSTRRAASERLDAFHAAMRASRARRSGAELVRRVPLDAGGRRRRDARAARRRPDARPRSSPRAPSSRSAALPRAASGVSGFPRSSRSPCFDDPYFGALLEPPLTAVGYDPSEVGRAAAALLVDAMRDGGERRELSVPVTPGPAPLVRLRGRMSTPPPAITLRGVTKRYGNHARAEADRPRDRRGRVLLPARPVGLRQDDDAEPDRRLRRRRRPVRSSSATSASTGCRPTGAASTRSSSRTRSSRT